MISISSQVNVSQLISTTLVGGTPEMHIWTFAAGYGEVAAS